VSTEEKMKKKKKEKGKKDITKSRKLRRVYTNDNSPIVSRNSAANEVPVPEREGVCYSHLPGVPLISRNYFSGILWRRVRRRRGFDYAKDRPEVRPRKIFIIIPFPSQIPDSCDSPYLPPLM
jgi:hypothetical protein